MKKALIAVVVVFALLPVVVQLMPKAITPERFVDALKAAGFSVEEVQSAPNPALGAVAQWSMKVNGADVQLYKFDDRGKLALQYEYQKPDAGSVIVESWNLSESLGAAKPKNKPITPMEKKMHLMTVTSEDNDLRARVARVFNSL